MKVGKAVEAKLAELKDNRLPAGVGCHKIFYQPERVGDSLGTFVINLIESVVIVVFILMLAMGFKSGDYRHQFGGDCFRIISFPQFRRGNDAACLSGWLSCWRWGCW